ncbi:MAG: hypothetical protein DRI33_04515 [Caldiserica bacterium]|nr:MAG: hypothetical protein DRI33_04515 [Caldisericota bacterium]
MFETLYPLAFETVTQELEKVFPDFRFYFYEVSDVDRIVFPYIVVYPLTMPRKRYLKDQRNFEFDFRIRIVDRQPVSQAVEKIKELLANVGKFVDNFDLRYYDVVIGEDSIKLLGDTRDMGVSTTFVRDNAYVVIGMSFVYHLEVAKY